MGDYKKLEVWQLACQFADRVDELIDTLPTVQRERALGQLGPAAHAIHENLAEGCGFDSDPQLLKYTKQSLATANESEDELLALDRKALLGDFADLLDTIRRICAMLAKLKRRLEIDVARGRQRTAVPKRRAETDSRERVREAKSKELSG
jgi:four helix bundle protein